LLSILDCVSENDFVAIGRTTGNDIVTSVSGTGATAKSTSGADVKCE